MATRNESVHTDAWITSYLEADASLMTMVSGAYSEVIPKGAAIPAIRYHVQGPNFDVPGVSANRIMVHLRYLIVVVGRVNSYGPLAPAADRLDVLLQDAQGSTATVNVLSVTRDEPFKMLEISDGEQWRHLGGLYHFVVQSK
jgi:hypothetical protein